MNIIAAVIGEFLRKRPIVCLYLFPQNVKRRFVYNPDENPCHACGPVRVPTASDATLRSSRGNRSSGHRSYLCSGIRPFTVHPPMQSVLNPSVPRLKPDDLTQTGSLQKPCKSFMSSSPFAPAHGAEQRAPHSLLVHISMLSARHQIKSAAN